MLVPPKHKEKYVHDLSCCCKQVPQRSESSAVQVLRDMLALETALAKIGMYGAGVLFEHFYFKVILYVVEFDRIGQSKQEQVATGKFRRIHTKYFCV